MIQLIAIDMDGTLLNPSHTISEVTKETILEAQSKGIEVVIATGRGYGEAYEPVHQKGLDLSFICLNGAEIRDNLGNLIAATYLPSEDIDNIITILETYHIDHQLFIDQTIYAKNIEDQIDTFVQLAEDAGQMPNIEEIRKEVEGRVARGVIQIVDSFDDLLRENRNELYKIFGTSFNRHDLDQARTALERIPSLAVTSSGAGNLEITSINAQKGLALSSFARTKNIPMEQIMAIGDNYNDLSMMTRAGRSVAMGNAPDAIKAACDEVTETNEHNGVALAIQKVLQQAELLR